ncbi:MAG: phospholipase D-like domain-containing protein, partial [Actinomycetota bacterium]|nr:phospholipase D-like domain-containing protein [Actinomycetota bacterium]
VAFGYNARFGGKQGTGDAYGTTKWDRNGAGSRPRACRPQGALGGVRSAARRRPKDGAGRYGSLHAKFAVADETTLLVLSANLTEYALNLNMELELLVRDGDLPARAVSHLRRLMEERVLLPI